MGGMVQKKAKQPHWPRRCSSGSLGNMLEWFDYGLYGYFAVIISTEFSHPKTPWLPSILEAL